LTGAVKNRYLLVQDMDQSIHDAKHWQLGCGQNNSRVPNNFGTTDGRLVITPDYQLMRFQPAVGAAPLPNPFSVYTLTH